MGGTKGKDHGLRLQQFIGNSSEMRNQTVTAATLIIVYTRNNSRVVTPNNVPLRHCATPPGRDPCPCSRKIM